MKYHKALWGIVGVASFAFVVHATSRDEVRLVAVHAQAVESSQPAGDAPVAPAGENALSDPVTLRNACCRMDDVPCPATPGEYRAGDTIVINSYWSEVRPQACPVEWEVDFSLAVRGDFGVAMLKQSERVEFGNVCSDFQPGEMIDFCVASLVTLPDQAAGASDILHGFGVSSPGGDLPMTGTGEFDVFEPMAILADLSVVSEVVALDGALEPLPVCLECEPPAAELKHHEISIPGGCGRSTPAANADCDCDGTMDDYKFDINGDEAGMEEAAPNGSVGLCCIDRSFYAVTFDPAGPAGPRFVGKCPFGRGRNLGWKYINPRTGHIGKVEWRSRDTGVDDDGDGSEDIWLYKYDVIQDTIAQCHTEDGMPGDSAGPMAPPEKPFKRADLLPKNPRNDDPTVERLPFDPFFDGGDDEEMAGEYASILTDTDVAVEIDSSVANEGPQSLATATVSVEVIAPAGCTVDGDSASTSSQTVTVDDVTLTDITDSFVIQCSTPGIAQFTITSTVEDADGGMGDPVAEDNRSVGTMTVEVVAP